jgi:flagellar capping protein FliD
MDTTLLGVEKTTTVEKTLTGTTAGTITDYQKISIEGSIISDLCNVAGYENDTTTNQTITFNKAYTTFNGIVANTTGLTITVSLTGITIKAPDTTTVYNGIILIQGV